MNPNVSEKPQDVKLFLELILQRTHNTAQTIQERVDNVSRRYHVTEASHDPAPACSSDG